MAIDAGGPAFPAVIIPPEATDEFAGMTLIDYFAAHAPTLIQDWFQPVIRPRPEVQWPDGTAGHYDVQPCNQADLDAWGREWAKALCIQWPWAWAQAMLAERKRIME